jgi:hypothetical protein
MHGKKPHSTSRLLAVVFTLLPAALAGAQGVPTFTFQPNNFTIQNGNLRISASKIQIDGLELSPFALVITSLTADPNSPNPTEFHTTSSPIWQVELRRGNLTPDPNSVQRILIPPRPDQEEMPPLPSEGTSWIDLVLVDDPNQLTLQKLSDSSGRMTWTGLAIVDSDGHQYTQTLSVTATITIDSEGASRWTIQANVFRPDGSTEDPWLVYAVRFPFFAFEAIGADGGEDDYVLMPQALGMLFRNPLDYSTLHRNHRGERVPRQVQGDMQHNPLNLPNCQRPKGDGANADGFYSYPGFTFSQFMAYYDPNAAGLLVRAEDPNGLTKHLYFNAGRSSIYVGGNRCYMYLTHFNSKTQETGLLTEFRSFDLAELYPSVVVSAFHGDWYDAAQRYRAWAQSENQAPGDENQPPERGFLWRGLLADRTDIADRDKLLPYSIRFQLPPTLPAEINDIAERGKLDLILGFYNHTIRRFFGDPMGPMPEEFGLFDFRPGMLVATHFYRVLPNGQQEVPDNQEDDERVEPLRPGVIEFLQGALASTNPNAVRVAAFNRDTTGFSYADTQALGKATPNQLSGDPFENLGKKGAVRTSCGKICAPEERANPAYPIIDPNHPRILEIRDCLGGTWTRDRRSGNVMQQFNATRPSPQEAPLVPWVLLSGDGSFSFPCFARLSPPLQVDTGDGDHDHLETGGGSFQTRGWRSLARAIRSPDDPDRIRVIGVEHAPETMISDFLLNGRAFADPVEDATLNKDWIPFGAQTVPLFKAMYHDYAHNVASLSPFAVAWRFYQNHLITTDGAMLRFRLAQVSVGQGRLFQIIFSQDTRDPNVVASEGYPYLDPNSMDFQAYRCHQNLLPVHRYAASLAVLRMAIPSHLAFGTALRELQIQPETVENDDNTITFPFTRTIGPDVHGIPATVPRIVGSAWFDPRETGPRTVVVVLTNFSSQRSTARFRIEPARWGLDPERTYVVEEKTGLTADENQGWGSPVVEEGEEGWGTFSGGDEAFYSRAVPIWSLEQTPVDQLVLAARRPWRIFRFRPTSNVIEE